MSRANITLEISLMHLCPDLHVPREVVRYFRGAARRAGRRVMSLEKSAATTRQALASLREHPASRQPAP